MTVSYGRSGHPVWDYTGNQQTWLGMVYPEGVAGICDYRAVNMNMETVGFAPTIVEAARLLAAPVAQRTEHPASNREDAGSTPVRGASQRVRAALEGFRGAERRMTDRQVERDF